MTLDSLAPVLRRYGIYARWLLRAGPLLTPVCLVVTALAAFAGTAVIVTTGHLIGALTLNDGSGDTWRWFWATAVAFFAGPLLLSASSAIAQIVTARYLELVFDLTMEAGTAPEGLSALEDPATASRYQALAEATHDHLFVAGIEATWRVTYIRLTGVGALVLLLAWRWWAALLLLVAYLYLSRKFTGWLNTVYDDVLALTGGDRRRASYFKSLLVAPSAAQEVRLFGLQKWLIDRFVSSWQSTLAVVWANRNQNLRSILWATVFSLAANALAFGLLARDAWDAAIPVATLVSLVQAVMALEAFGPVGDQQSAIARQTSTIAEVEALRRDLAIVEGGRTMRLRSTVSATPTEIVVEGVSFGYPSTGRTVLTDVDFRIPAGQSTALVGLNGAGKSTLIKLLCGLYQPDSGRILLNSAPASESRVGVVFQTFTKYHLSLRENLTLGAGARAIPDSVAEQALRDAGGAELPSRLQNGWDTILSAEYTGGTDLSGGQWQRVVLGRALTSLSAGAGLLILDEPTAALDVRAEAELFDHFLEVTRGATTLLVSHRLSSVRHAERILVLGERADGTSGIVEDGTHDELMCASGRYAELFRLQASRFANTGAAK